MASQASPFDQPHNWFFIRGLAREAGHWGVFPEAFAKAFPNSTVTCLDLPGAGVYRDQATPVSIPLMAASVRDRFQQTLESQRRDGTDLKGARQNFVLSISLGGMVALDWIRQFESDLSGAVLINSSLRGFSPMFKRMQPSAFLTLLRAISSSSVEAREGRILSLVVNDAAKRERALETWVHLHKTRPISVRNAWRQLFAALSHRPSVPASVPPLLLLNSLGDRLAHHSCSEDIGRKFGISPKTHPSAGHDLTIDDPQWLIQEILGWRPLSK